MKTKGFVALWHGSNLLEVFESFRYKLRRSTVFARHVCDFTGGKKLFRNEISILQRWRIVPAHARFVSPRDRLENTRAFRKLLLIIKIRCPLILSC
jgi:hypothetical protein